VKERLQKLISRSGLASRRKAEEWILQGRVAVNGVTAGLGDRADLACDRVTVDGRPLRLPADAIVVLLNKPRGYLCSLDDPQGRPLVTRLVESVPQRLYPVGRLDFDSEGLLLLTNDGDLAHRLMHPRHHVEKCYQVEVQGRLSQDDLLNLARGVELDDGRTAPAGVRALPEGKHGSRFEIVLQEGRNRQIRRMCDAIGHRVRRLQRVRIDFLTLARLKPGEFRILKDSEIERLKKG
jgi:23S rRNA pseudouridine2605 synthase